MNRKRLSHLIKSLEMTVTILKTVIDGDDNTDSALEVAIVSAANTTQAMEEELKPVAKPQQLGAVGK